MMYENNNFGMKICKLLIVSMIALVFTGCSAGSGPMTEAERQINNDVDKVLKEFAEIKGSNNVLRKAKGILVFPKVYKGGIGIGAEYGEGALRVRGRTVDYYSTAAGSIGFQLGGQRKTMIFAFMTKKALKEFQESSGWKIGADASIAVIAVGAGGSIDSARLNQPIVAVVFGQKGLMYNLTLEGTKITKIKK